MTFSPFPLIEKPFSQYILDYTVPYNIERRIILIQQDNYILTNIFSFLFVLNWQIWILILILVLFIYLFVIIINAMLTNGHNITSSMKLKLFSQTITIHMDNTKSI